MSSFTKESFNLKQTLVEHVSALYHKPWFIRLLSLCFTILSCISIISTWVIFIDLTQQVPGLVFDRQPDYVIYLVFACGFAEFLLFAINCSIWYRLIRYKLSDWIILDLTDLITICLAQIPLSILLVMTSSCQESSISLGLFIKAFVLVLYVVFRFAFCLTTFVSDMIDTNYTDLDANPQTEASQKFSLSMPSPSTTPVPTPKPLDSDSNQTLWPSWLNVDKLRKRSGLIRSLLIIGLLILFVLGILVFNLSVYQTYHGYLEWHRVEQDSRVRNPFVDRMAERYFHDVEIFMQELPNLPNKWLHLISLEKLMKLHYLNVRETISLNHVRVNKVGLIVEFVQMLHYPNGTRENSRTCWQVMKMDLFREQDCDQIFGSGEVEDGSASDDGARKKPETEVVKSVRLEFVYQPPSRHQHLGEIFYKASRVNSNGTVVLNFPIKLQYFQNPVVHRSIRASSLREIDNSHHHDGWTSGPFRPKVTQKSHFFMPYDTLNGDIISVSEIWKTGVGKCRTSASLGPKPMKVEQSRAEFV